MFSQCMAGGSAPAVLPALPLSVTLSGGKAAARFGRGAAASEQSPAPLLQGLLLARKLGSVEPLVPLQPAVRPLSTWAGRVCVPMGSPSSSTELVPISAS